MVCRSAVKLANTRPNGDGKKGLLAEALTLGSGARAAFPDLLVPSQTVFPPKPISIDEAGVDIDAIRAANSVLDHPVDTGQLGSMVHAEGLKTAVINDYGNAATGRSAEMIVMDSSGRVDFVDPAGRAFIEDETYPFGIRTDLLKISVSLHQVENSASMIVVQFSDLERAKEYANYSMPGVDKMHLKRARSELNFLLRFLRVYVSARQNCRLMILGLPGDDGENTIQNRLQPVIFVGDRVSPGTLYSASTRRNGIVLDVDYLPTAADYLQLDRRRTHYGRPMQFKPGLLSLDPVQRFVETHNNLIRAAHLQNILGGLPTIQLLLVIAGVLAIAFCRNVCWVRSSGIAIASLPLGMLVLPPLTQGSVPISSALLLVFVMVLAGLGWDSSSHGRRSRGVLEAVCAALLLVILGDLLTGSRLMMQAWMSYSVVEGARFYGIGNEYMGAVIGAGCVLIYSRSRNIHPEGGLSSDSVFRFSTERIDLIVRIGIYVLLGLLVLVMGAPQFGAKVGAVPTAIIGFIAALASVNGGRINKKSVLLMIVAIILVFALNIIADLHNSAAGQSHFIRAIHGVGVESFWSIGIRKLGMEARLLVTSPWSLTMAVAAAAFRWQSTIVRKQNSNLPATKLPTAGIWVCAAAALLCNDSGVTAAALIFLYGWAMAATGFRTTDASTDR